MVGITKRFRCVDGRIRRIHPRRSRYSPPRCRTVCQSGDKTMKWFILAIFLANLLLFGVNTADACDSQGCPPGTFSAPVNVIGGGTVPGCWTPASFAEVHEWEANQVAAQPAVAND